MYDVIIVGAGVSGLMLANQLKTKNYLILEKNSTAGKKLLLTGGGRCNLTNLKSNTDFLNNINHNKKYLYSTINFFGPTEIYNYFKKINLKKETDDQIFPVSNKAGDVLHHLIKNIKINYNEEVIDINIKEDYKEIITNKNIYKTKNVVIATGGLSYPQTGSDGFYKKVCQKINQPVTKTFPAETGIILEKNYDLAGTSFDTVKIKNLKSEGNLMFTHKGLSGTSIMNVSGEIYLKQIKEITIDFLPQVTNFEQINQELSVTTLLNNYFSKKFTNYLLQMANIENNKKIKQINKKALEKLYNLIKNQTFKIKKVNDINIAYVTGGGVDLKQIDTKTFESKTNKGFYFIGECLDIHGPIGGYNITLALSTAASCARSIEGSEV